jgi:hypothetical protein
MVKRCNASPRISRLAPLRDVDIALLGEGQLRSVACLLHRWISMKLGVGRAAFREVRHYAENQLLRERGAWQSCRYCVGASSELAGTFRIIQSRKSKPSLILARAFASTQSGLAALGAQRSGLASCLAPKRRSSALILQQGCKKNWRNLSSCSGPPLPRPRDPADRRRVSS